MTLSKDWLYALVAFIARIHDKIVAYNKSFTPTPFTDKDLHFIVMGLFGLVVFGLCLLLFRFLARRGLVGLMAWLLALFVLVSVCFAVEMGQYVTKTGSMELGDIVYGIVGFLAASAVAAVCWLLVCLFRWLFRRGRRRKRW